MVSSWHSLQQLQHLALIGLSVTAQDAPALTAFLAAGAAVTLTSLILGDQQGLSFLSDAALDGLGALLSSSGSCGGSRGGSSSSSCGSSSSSSRGLRVLDLSGCIEITDAGERRGRRGECMCGGGTSLILSQAGGGGGFLSDAALEGLGALLSSSCGSGNSSSCSDGSSGGSSRGLWVDLSGCIEITDAGEGV